MARETGTLRLWGFDSSGNASKGDRLDLARKLRQHSLHDAVGLVASGGRLSVPLVVELDPTTFCDLACPECVSIRLLNRKRFTSQRLLVLSEEMVESGVRAVILIGGGEPLTHPGTPSVIRVLGESGIAVGVTTNGTQIHRHLEVLATYARWVRVSLDAGTPQTYARFRPGYGDPNGFERVVQNLRDLARARSGILGISYLLMTRFDTNGRIRESNFAEVYQAGRLALEVGCDYFEVKPAYDTRHYLIPQPRELTRSVSEQIEALRAITTPHFIAVHPHFLDVVLPGADTEEHKTYDRCLVSELRTLLTPDGAFVCPYFRGIPKRRFGDPTQQSIREMWSSSRRGRVMAQTQPSRDCRFHCIRHRSNMLLEAISRSQAQLELLSDYDPFL